MNISEYKEIVFKERPDVKKEYDALEPEFERIRELLKTREELNPTAVIGKNRNQQS